MEEIDTPPQPQELVPEDFMEVKKYKKRKREKSTDESKNERKRRKRRMLNRKKDGWYFLGVKAEDIFKTSGKNEIEFEIEDFCKLLTDDQVEKLQLDGSRVSVDPTEKELKEEKRRYREEYRNQEHVIKKRQEKNTSSEEKKKRKAYSMKPAVKERKKKLSQKNRQILKDIKLKCPDIFDKIESEVNEKLKVDLPSFKGSKRWVPKEAWLIPPELLDEDCFVK